MLSLDMKLVTRLRGLSLTSNSSGSNNTSSTPPSPAPTILSTQVQVTSTTTTSSSVSSLNERRRSRESGNGNNVSPTTSDHESDEEITSPRIVRDRSRSVCMPVLTSSQLRHLHRRASHHVQVFYCCKEKKEKRNVYKKWRDKIKEKKKIKRVKIYTKVEKNCRFIEITSIVHVLYIIIQSLECTLFDASSYLVHTNKYIHIYTMFNNTGLLTQRIILGYYIIVKWDE